MDDKENLLYHPELRPERNYWSDALILDAETSTMEDRPLETHDQVQKLLSDYREIGEILELLPDEVPAMIKDPINSIIKQTEVMFPPGEKQPQPLQPDLYEPLKEDPSLPDFYPIFENSDAVGDGGYALPDLLPVPTEVKIEVLKPKSLVEIARELYRRDSIDLKEDYLNKLQSVIQRYLQEMVMLMAETGVGKMKFLTKEFDGETVYVGDSDLKHLSDYVVRSQIIRQQIIRFFKKTHNVDQTLMHMRAWHAAQVQRERYLQAEYGSSESYMETQSNALLRESRLIYDKKYKSTLYNMYKYLDASVVMISDLLTMSLKESQAKGILLKHGVNIYATRESIAAVNTDTGTETNDVNENSSKEQSTQKNERTDTEKN